MLTTYVAGLRRRVGRSFCHQLRKLYSLCHEYQISEVEQVVARAIEYDLFDVTRLEGMLLKEYGARLFGFRKRSKTEGSPSGCLASTPQFPTPETSPLDTPPPSTTTDNPGSRDDNEEGGHGDA